MDKLCQLEDKSCVACCGTMLFTQSKQDLSESFRYHREAYKRFLQGKGDISGYESEIGKREPILYLRSAVPADKPKCHFLGFLDDDERRVGCLANPIMNNGTDLRVYGSFESAELCERFRCKLYRIYDAFSPWERALFQHAVDDWTWYELSHIPRLTQLISFFRARLQRIKEIVDPQMDPCMVREQVRGMLF